MKDDHSLFYKQIFNHLPFAVCTVDQKLRISSFNKKAEVLISITNKDAISKDYGEIIRLDFSKKGCPIYSAITTGQSYLDLSGSLLTFLNTQIKIKISVLPMRNSNLVIQGCVATLQQDSRECQDSSNIHRAVQACELKSIQTALRKNNNNRTAAAKDLGIHKSTFFRKIKKMGIDLPPQDGRFRNKGQVVE